MNSKRVLIALVVLAVIFAAINFLIRPPRTYDVRVVTPPTIIASLPHWVAVERGFYRDAGLKVVTVDVTSSDLMAQALITGDADVLPAVSLVDVLKASTTSPNRPLIYSHSRMRLDPPFESLIVARGSTLSTLKDLEGKRIAVYPGPTAEAATRLYLERNKIDISKIEFIKLAPPEHLQALQRGDVAASHIYEPQRSANLETGTTREISGSIYAFLQEPSAIGASAISSRFYRDQNEAAKLYLEAWDKSIQFIRDHPAEAREILRKKLRLTNAVAMKATWVDATKVGEVDLGIVRATAGVFQQMGAIDRSLEINESFFLSPR